MTDVHRPTYENLAAQKADCREKLDYIVAELQKAAAGLDDADADMEGYYTPLTERLYVVMFPPDDCPECDYPRVARVLVECNTCDKRIEFLGLDLD